MRNMAFSMTKAQIRAGTKTVTRRMGWDNLAVGEEFCAIEKGQGLKKGEKIVRMAILRCVSNSRERLFALIERPAYGKEEAKREGFPEMDGIDFVNFFCRGHREPNGDRCTAQSKPSRIGFEYVKFLP